MYPVDRTLPPAIFLMGPTASGKTALAVEMAQQINAEIISVDSALVYRGMDIGTAKPTNEERQGIVHHLIDILDPVESYSTGKFRKSALQCMQEISGRNKIPLLVGGTMLYFNALLNGLAVLPESNIDIRSQLNIDFERYGKQAMHQRLEKIDPPSAARIHPNDPQRVQRAIEVYELSGKPLSQFFQEAKHNTLPYKIIKMIVAPGNRKQLHEIIAQRFHAMIANGFLDEVHTLYQRQDLHSGLSSVRAVGYRQAWCYLDNLYEKDEMIEKAIIATRQLAKRQFTWLRRETDAIKLESYDKNLTKKSLQSINHVL